MNELFIVTILLLDQNRQLHYTRGLGLHPDGSLIKRILYVGIPNGLENGMFQLGKIVLLSLVALYGTSAITANAITQNMAQIQLIPAFAVNMAVTYISVRFLGWHVYGIVVAMTFYPLTVMVLNSLAIRKYCGYSYKLRKLGAPLLAAIVMSVFVAAVYWAPKLLLPQVFDRYLTSAVLMAASVLIGIIVYFIAYDRFAQLSDEEMKRIPGGTRLLVIFRRLGIRK